MNKKRFVLAFLTAFISLSIFAQNCPQGIPQGTPSCVPPDQLGYSTAPPVNTAYWKKTWGAMASSPEMREIGTSTGQFSRRSAVKEAIRNCKSKGGKACELSLAYHNQCVVMAQPIRESGQSSSVNSISQSAPTIESASQLALPNCSKLNEGKKCEIFYSNCTEPVLIR
ncbi:DUF4189 domain-containing protein [Acinetobacter bereziniae]|uniref:DUF4189 domain-containing protein n=1 Tax=Acinetobacter bereziniae TaxID=106648 RepID=UPI0012508161|nr:DUF4189 domain-containing protein [Acinetobacter bereziniae]MDA3439492.1 DUF4189 domain-containing protein [Acinetobacter bereziniae]